MLLLQVLLQAQALLLLGRREESRALAQKAAGEWPEDAGCQQLLAQQALQVNDLPRALACIERACSLALYIIENKATMRAAAQKFGISKSTVHKDLSERLPAFNRPLYLQVKSVLDVNKAQRHIRGGIATRRKYKGDL